MIPRFSIALLAAISFCSGCAKTEKSPSNEAKIFIVNGYVQQIEDEGARLIIDHEEIPNYMPPMVMPFNVKATENLGDLEPGDQIQFSYVVEPTRSWIEAIEKTGQQRAPLEIEPSKAPLLNINEVLPDYAFTNQNGQSIRLSDYRGRPIALTFVFTRCPVPEYCPAMMRHFGSVDKMLRSHPSAPKSWQLLTISFDPEHDSPAVMKQYGEAFGYDPERWSLLTASSTEIIEAIADQVGLKFGKENGTYIHNLRTVVLDTNGRMTKLFTDESWTPEDLVEEIVRVGLDH